PAAPPTRTSSRRDFGSPGAPSYGPAATGMTLPPLSSPASSAPPAATPPASVAPRPDGPVRRSPFAASGTDSPFGTTSAPTSAPSARAAAPSAPASAPPAAAAPPLPWATPSTPPADRPAAVQPSRPARGSPTPSGPERTAASPFDALVASEQPVRARSAAPQVEEDDEEDWDEPEASYTWLHYIVLVVVAFVLGLLVWKLLLAGPDDKSFSTDSAAPAATLSLTTSHPGAAA
ncbi:hypothetical protein ACWGKI_05360, partial [Isoptericola sp. NPDC055881]